MVYDHASRFMGLTSPTRTFENAAREGVTRGGEKLASAVGALQNLFRGIHNDLYDKYRPELHETSLRTAWNRRLGEDAKIVVNKSNRSRSLLQYSAHRSPSRTLRASSAGLGKCRRKGERNSSARYAR